MARLHDIDVIFQTHTEKGVCVRGEEGGKDVWIPKAQCEIDPGYDQAERGDTVTLTATEGLLADKGLI